MAEYDPLYDGMPYYCVACGATWFQWLDCGQARRCKLENDNVAEARQKKHELERRREHGHYTRPA